MRTQKQLSPISFLFVLTAGLSGCEALSPPPATDIWLPDLFGDHMVVQQDNDIPIWGTAGPGESVTVRMLTQEHHAIVDSDGNWRVDLAPLDAGGPFELTIIGADTRTITDVMVGEVWVGSGQSNMEMPIAGWGHVLNYEEEIASSDYPDLRLFQVEQTIAYTPQADVENTGWQRSSPSTVPEFSSTAYFLDAICTRRWAFRLV